MLIEAESNTNFKWFVTTFEFGSVIIDFKIIQCTFTPALQWWMRPGVRSQSMVDFFPRALLERTHVVMRCQWTRLCPRASVLRARRSASLVRCGTLVSCALLLVNVYHWSTDCSTRQTHDDDLDSSRQWR